ncbi:MAG TPA: DUF1131 domain-containing protein [Caulobacteraceae bacterium]|nr:DUF1131 domain-containing protein [Caulobacteraceae bacterium]
MNRPFAVVLAGLVVVACAPSPMKEAGAPKAEPYRSGPILVGSWGVGPIRARTYFETARIFDLFPLAVVQKGTVRIAPDETTAAITVTQGGVQLLEIDDGTENVPGTNDPMIGSVRAMGGPVVGPHGERLGMTWRAAKMDLSECEVGVERDANAVICARPGEGAVMYQFAAPGWDSEEMPPDSVLSRGGYIKAIIWTPPAPP